MASEEDDSRGSVLIGHTGATLMSALSPAANEPRRDSDAEDADETTLTVPDRRLAAGQAGLAERPQEMMNVWVRHPALGWCWIKAFNKEGGRATTR